MPYSNTRQIKEDVLFRGGEPIAGSQFDAKVVDYINRVYFAIASGASEFLSEYIDDWWWLRASDSLVLEPRLLGQVAVTNGSTSITFGASIADSMVGRILKVDGHADMFTIASHTGGTADATLDIAYTGLTNPAADYTLMKTVYTLNASVAALIGPMRLYVEPYRIDGMAPEGLDLNYPPQHLQPGVPRVYALENEQQVRFSHGGRTDGLKMRVEYRYRPVVASLTDDVSSVPLMPNQWRHILADGALTMLFLDKNDDRSQGAAVSTRSGLLGMLKENRRRFTKIDTTLARIYPRQSTNTMSLGP
jgi:hypothetical protein